MPFKSRLLIGMNGCEPDVHLIRYASMVVRRLEVARRLKTKNGSYSLVLTNGTSGTHQTLVSNPPEIRFVYLMPKLKSAQLSSIPHRSELHAQIQTNFKDISDQMIVSCDLLKGKALNRLSDIAADFDSELLLLGDSPWPRRKCGQLSVAAPCPVWLVPPAWAPVLRRVLVPIEFSERSAECLRMACALMSHSPNAKCVALHVYRHDGRFVNHDYDRSTRRALSEKYESFMETIDTQGTVVEPLFVQSHRVDRAIAAVADHHVADLIIMSSRGRSSLAGMFGSSITERAIRQSRTSFLIMKSTEPCVGLWQILRTRLSTGDEVQFS